MRNTLLPSLATLALSSSLAHAGACSSASLTTYLSGGSNSTCSVADLSFSNMQYAETGSMALPASDIFVTPDNISGDAGLTFSGDFSISTPGQTKDALLDFNVTALALPINDATVTLVGSTGALGSYSDTLDLFSTSFPPSFVGGLEVTDSNPTTTIDFTDEPSLAASDDLLLTGVEDLSQITKQFSYGPLESRDVAEPGSLALLGASLLGLGFFLRRKTKLALRYNIGL